MQRSVYGLHAPVRQLMERRLVSEASVYPISVPDSNDVNILLCRTRTCLALDRPTFISTSSWVVTSPWTLQISSEVRNVLYPTSLIGL